MAAVPENEFKAYLERTRKRGIDGPTEQEFMNRVVKEHERKEQRAQKESLHSREC
jgi:hypothetical protein